MRILLGLGCGCLLAGFAFAEHQNGAVVVTAGHPGHAGTHNPARPRSSVREYRRGLYPGYGYGYFADYDGSGPVFAPPAPSAPAGPAAMIVNPQAAPVPQPPIHSVIHEYGQAEDYGTGSAAGTAPVLYLIAFRGDNIRAAMTYWVDGSTLHYLDTNHSERQAPLDMVDRDLSLRLNRERHVPFNLQ